MTDILRKKGDCKARAIWSFATYHIYTKRMRRLDQLLRFNTTLGILTPALVGAIVSTYGQGNYFQPLLYVAGAVLIVQLAISVVSLTYNWEDRKSYYLESSIANRKLYEDYKKLYQFETDDITFNSGYVNVTDLDRSQNDKDDKYPFSEKENRRGTRYAFIHFQEVCPVCGQKPISMKPTNCDNCGNF